MAEEAPAAAPAKAPAKAAKKKAAPRAKKEGPSLPKLIVGSVAESKERKGTSLAAIKKYLAAKNVDVPKANKRINTAVAKLVEKGVLSQVKGTGASERCLMQISLCCPPHAIGCFVVTQTAHVLWPEG
uniref:H15 domain-containing protein n=1 Tax=Amphilophus citrinellus TaxID=61819 RepID=A0A3Q0RKC2_AMPCI